MTARLEEGDDRPCMLLSLSLPRSLAPPLLRSLALSSAALSPLVFCFWKYIFSINLSALRGWRAAGASEERTAKRSAVVVGVARLILFLFRFFRCCWQLVKRSKNNNNNNGSTTCGSHLCVVARI